MAIAANEGKAAESVAANAANAAACMAAFAFVAAKTANEDDVPPPGTYAGTVFARAPAEDDSCRVEYRSWNKKLLI